MDLRELEYWELREQDERSAEIQYFLGCCCEEGRGIEADSKEATYWFELAAAQGHKEAQEKLNKLTQQSDVEPITKETCPFWCMKAEDGDNDAQYRVAMYLLENYPNEWPEDIERYLTMATASKNGKACLALARLKLKKKPQEAIDLLTNALDEKITEAAEQLGYCYLNGIGVKKDVERAKRYFEDYALNSGAEAMLELARRYKKGFFGKESISDAYYWVDKAEEAGMADAAARFAAEQ